MSDPSISRRDFMQGSGAAAGSTLLRTAWPAALAVAESACSARDKAAPFRILAADEARELEAVAARILPTTGTPGAREAGVVYFFDNLEGTEIAGLLDGLRQTMAPFEAGIAERFPGAQRFSDLGEADQDAWLADREATPFFGMIRALTIMGFFAMSSWGGNKGNLSWNLIGFEGPGAAQPPFGYYDAQYLRETNNGG